MTRLLSIAALLLLLALMAVGAIGYLSYGIDEEPPEETRLAGLTAQARIAWLRNDAALLSVADSLDLYRALGYTHGAARGWQAVLWRQTALGRLSTWYGPSTLPVDQITHQLGLAELAQATYEALPEPERDVLRAYTDGMNAALSEAPVRRQAPFLQIDVLPEAWQPWHPLATERLFAWLGTRPPDSTAHAGVEARRFFADDSLLRDWLHLHGFEHSLAWAARDSAGPLLAQRHVLGASATAVVQEVGVIGQDDTTWVATVPGTLLFPGGRSASHAWARFMTSPMRLTTVPRDTTRRPTFARVESDDGTEHLLRFTRTQDALIFAPPAPRRAGPPLPDSLRAPLDLPPPEPDTTWAVRWPGFAPGTDLPAWRALLEGRVRPFRLFDGAGLDVGSSGSPQVAGSPAVRAALDGGGVLVSPSEWAEPVAQHVDSLLQADSLVVRAWLDDTYSRWAAQRAPSLVAAIDTALATPASVEDAMTYLRNWDHHYTSSSIAASIFDTWLALYRTETGAFPVPPQPDDTLRIRALLQLSILEQTVDTLTAQFGDDLSQWRWERVQPARRFVPGRYTGAAEVPARFAPIDLPGRGHPSALAWGGSPVLRGTASPLTWESLARPRGSTPLLVRTSHIDFDRFLGRYLVPDPPAPLQRLTGEAPLSRTDLYPAPNL